MLSVAIEDEEKWLAEGIAGIQHNAFYMHQAVVSPIFTLTIFFFLEIRRFNCIGIALISLLLLIFVVSGHGQPQRSPQILGSDAFGASNFEAFTT